MQINRGKIVTVAIVGAGQIGSRHLQALSRSTRVHRLEVVGRSATSLKTAQERYRSVARSGAPPVSFTHRISDLSERLDVVIVATSSDTRLAVMQELLRTKNVGAFILEKVVFQSRQEFDAAMQALGARGAAAWVNCFRRALPLYAGLREQLAREPGWSLTVDGGQWGLGCNAVHYVDLCAFLAGSDEIRLDPGSALDPAVLASKRPGFVEFTGTIRGSCGAHRFELIARAGSDEGPAVRIGVSGRTLAVDESSLPLQSELTQKLVEEILASGRSSLPTLEQSRAAHLPLLDLFAGHLERVTGKRPARCPIT